MRAFEEVIQTSSQILSKLDLERLILVLRTRFVDITPVSIRIAIETSHIFGPNVNTYALLRIRSYAPANFEKKNDIHRVFAKAFSKRT